MFLQDPTKEYNIREISKKAKINYRLAFKGAMEFGKEGVIAVNKKGMMNLCRINLSADIPLYTYIEGLRRNLLQKRHAKIKVILHELEQISTYYFTALIFGSYAAGKERKNSDLDLLFIVPEQVDTEKFDAEIKSRLGQLSYRLDINVISEKGFLILKKEKKLNIAQEVVPNHILLRGAEAYYQLIAQ